MDSYITDWAKLGILGLIIVALGFTVRYLFNTLTASQQSRIDELKTSLTAINANTNALTSLTAILQERNKG